MPVTKYKPQHSPQSFEKRVTDAADKAEKNVTRSRAAVAHSQRLIGQSRSMIEEAKRRRRG